MTYCPAPFEAVTPADLLREARGLIFDLDHWTTGAYARDADGNAVVVHDERACKFCLLGAVDRAAANRGLSRYHDARCQAVAALGRALPDPDASSITSHNDKLGHAASLLLVDRALAAMEAA